MARRTTLRFVGTLAASAVLVTLGSIEISHDPRTPRSDTSEVRPCQKDPVQVAFKTAYERRDGYLVADALLSGLDTRAVACGGHQLQVALNGGGGVLARRTVRVPLSGTRLAVRFDKVRAADVIGVAVAVY